MNLHCDFCLIVIGPGELYYVLDGTGGERACEECQREEADPQWNDLPVWAPAHS